MKATIPPVERVLRRVVAAPNGCIVFVGRLHALGYGSIAVGSRIDGTKRTSQVHRVVYEAMVGRVPEGLELDHLCSNRACVNPTHLEPVTHHENILRSAARGRMGTANRRKTHCPNGHEYSTGNTYLRPEACNQRGRNCRACGRERALADYRANGDPRKRRAR